MKKAKRIKSIRRIVIIAFAAIIGLMAAGCETDPGDTGTPTEFNTQRYETVHFGTPEFGTPEYFAAGNDQYLLIHSAKTIDDSERYYVFYMGYVRGVPIAHKTNWEYNGVTPITITFEKSTATEQGVVEAITRAQEESWENSSTWESKDTWSRERSTMVSLGAKTTGGVPLIGEVEFSTKVEQTFASSLGGENTTGGGRTLSGSVSTELL